MILQNFTASKHIQTMLWLGERHEIGNTLGCKYRVNRVKPTTFLGVLRAPWARWDVALSTHSQPHFQFHFFVNIPCLSSTYP